MRYRILTDDRWASAHGISRYGKELLCRLEEKFDVIRMEKTCSIQDPLAPWKMSAAIKKQLGDVFWSPGFIPPSFSPIPFVFTLHDLNYVRVGNRLHAAYFNFVVKPLCRRAAKIATVSEFSRSEICSWANLAPEKVVVIPNGVSRLYNPDGLQYHPGFPYLLYVGNHMPHKNLKCMLKAFAVSQLALEIRFLLSGDPEPELVKLAAGLGIKERVIFAGAIPERDLPAYYRGALAVTLLSTNEGFGLPVLEAMACGVPVLASRATSLPEIAGGAALLVDPFNVEEIAQGMRRIICDNELRTGCRQKGREQSRKFDWDQSANLLSSVLVEAVDAR
jgi:glycosyltransferase involved in cell wall biosynthesis